MIQKEKMGQNQIKKSNEHELEKIQPKADLKEVDMRQDQKIDFKELRINGRDRS